MPCPSAETNTERFSVQAFLNSLMCPERHIPSVYLEKTSRLPVRERKHFIFATFPHGNTGKWYR